MPDSGTPGSPRELARDLQELLLGAAGVEDFLTEVAQLAASQFATALAAGLTVRADPDGQLWAATSDEFARRMDAIQYDVDDGPCLTCLRIGTPIEVGDIGSDPRWPAFSERGRAEGAGASLSVPLIVGARTMGAINLYSQVPYAFTPDDHERARRLANQAAGAVGLALLLADREERSRHLEVALTSRSVIDQALGILMGRHGITAAQAFDMLRRRSQRTNVKLRDVAAALVDEVTSGPPRRPGTDASVR